MKTVILHGKKAAGRVALVDDADYDLVMQYRWHLWDCREGRGGPYAMTSITRNGVGTTTRMHQVLTGWPQTDHIDRDGLNNQRYNLRPATTRQNGLNRSAGPGSSHFKGVKWHKVAKRWQARIVDHGVRVELGFYRDEEDAARAYDAAARDLFGEFAYLNFPDSFEQPTRVRRVTHPDVDDAVIAALRADGLKWSDVAVEVGMSVTGVRKRWAQMQKRAA